MSTVGVCEDSVLVLETSVTPDWRVVHGRKGTSEGPGDWGSRAGEPGRGFGGEIGRRTLTGLCCVEHGGGGGASRERALANEKRGETNQAFVPKKGRGRGMPGGV